MIKLNYAQIRDVNFNPLLQRLLESKLPYSQARNIVDLFYVIRSEQQKAQELWEMLHKRWLRPVNKNEPLGAAKLDEDLTADEKNQALQELSDFLKTEVSIPLDRIPNSILEQMQLSANDLLLIEGLFKQ